MKKIAIFASGSGSNAENIAGYFAAGNTARVELILTNRPDAKVLRRAEKLQIESVVFDRDTFYNSDRIVVLMRRRQIDYVVLAGFLWLVPENLLTAYPNRIVNIHPALLPRHGGKGMYGDRVHRAVVEAGDRETGITIHRVNERYDSGDILAQYRVPVTETDTPETVAAKVHALVDAGDKKAVTVWNAMIYQLCKSIGGMAAVLEGKVDGILLTGGLMRYDDILKGVEQRCGWIAPITVYPGECEQEAMADAVLEVLRGQRQANRYTGVPVFQGFEWDK